MYQPLSLSRYVQVCSATTNGRRVRQVVVVFYPIIQFCISMSNNLCVVKQQLKNLHLLAIACICGLGAVAQTPVSVVASGGTNAQYSTLQAAFNAINSGTHTGTIVISVTGNTVESAPAILNGSGAGSASYTSLLLQPTANNISIAGNFTNTGRGVIELNGADNVTINGDNPNSAGTNRDLTIRFSSVQTVSQSLVRLVTSSLPINCNNVTITNCIILGNVTNGNRSSIISSTSSAALSMGIVAAGGGSTTSATAAPSALSTGGVALIATAGSTLNNFEVSNCSINQVGVGIHFYGNSAATSNQVRFTNNTIGTAGSLGSFPGGPSSTVYFKGIFYRGVTAAEITGNSIQGICSYFISGTTPNIVSAIECNSFFNNGGGIINISNNNITGVWSNNAADRNTTQIARGIIMLGSAARTTINCHNNQITNIQSNTVSNVNNIAAVAIDLGINTNNPQLVISNNNIQTVASSKPWGVAGISLSSGGNNAQVYNNRVSSIAAAEGGTALNTITAGIRVTAGTGHKIYHNSVLLNGNLGSSQHISAALLVTVQTASANIDIRNNVLANYSTAVNGTNSADAALILNASLTQSNRYVINNNAYFGTYGSGNNYLAYLYNLTAFSNPGSTNSYNYANFNSAATSPSTNFRAFSSGLTPAGTNDGSSYALRQVAPVPFASESDLHINTAYAVDIKGNSLESTGATGLTVQGIGIGTDFENNLRSDIAGATNGGGTQPDIGADEFDGVPLLQACTGTPIAGSITANNTNFYCTAGASSSRTFTLSSYTSHMESIILQWQQSVVSATSGFTDIANENLSNYTTTVIPAQTTWYRVKIICSNSGQEAFSAAIITHIVNRWIGANGNWNNAANWSCGIPGSNDDVLIEDGHPQLDIDYTAGKTLTLTGTGNLTILAGKQFSVAASGIVKWNNREVTLRSTNMGNGAIGNIAGSLQGATNVTIERFIPAHTDRAWRLLSVPTMGNGQTIRQAWQEGDANPLALDNNNGFGTQITGAGTIAAVQAAGFDNVSARSSILNIVGNATAQVTSTNIPIETKGGWFLYIRGNRSVGINSSITNNNTSATLRTNGTIYQGSQTSETIPANSSGTVGNIYPSAIDFTQLSRNGGLSDVFYIWDPKKTSGSSLGAYQTFSATNGYRCILADGSYTLGEVNTTIECGQAFIVQASGSSGSLGFTESAKLSGSSTRGFRPAPAPAAISATLYAIQNDKRLTADAAVVVYSNELSNNLDGRDAPKLMNNGENMGILRQGKQLAIEGRHPITTTDTIFYTLSKLKKGRYQVCFSSRRISNLLVNATLHDSYLNKQYRIKLSDSTWYSFETDDNAASMASGRLMLVLKAVVPTASRIKPTAGQLTLSPNPVQNKQANILLHQTKSGLYNLQVYDAAGQLVVQQTIMHQAGKKTYALQLPAQLARGTYQLIVTGDNKTKLQTTMIVAE
jgi:hypothetical protein